jgi:hypothetical protein
VQACPEYQRGQKFEGAYWWGVDIDDVVAYYPKSPDGDYSKVHPDAEDIIIKLPPITQNDYMSCTYTYKL